jgi:dihydroxyacetone kinase
MSQFFFNQRTRLVDDVIEGTIVASPWNNLARLESDPAIRVVVRRDLNKSNVAPSPAAAPAMSRPTSGLSVKGC